MVTVILTANWNNVLSNKIKRSSGDERIHYVVY